MSDQGEAFAAFIQRELEFERDRRKNFDTRGTAVVTTSGSLAALLAAVGAFVTARSDFRLPPEAGGSLILTLLAFAGSAFCGIMAALPKLHQGVLHTDALSIMATDRWKTDEVKARNFVAQADVAAVQALREANKAKGNWLLWALFAQVLALLFLTTTVYLAVRSAT